MATYATGNWKHLTLSDRCKIEVMLEKGANFSQIARELCKDSSTISKEIRKHRFCVPHYHDEINKKRSECVHYPTCRLQGLCGKVDCTALCPACRGKRCTLYCPSFEVRQCERLGKPPYVCNTCPKLRSCSHDFFFYRAKYADDAYQELKISSRTGINQTPESLEQLDRLVSPLLKQGQPLSHIYLNHKDEIPCTMRTLYHYIDQRLFTAINLDLPRKVKYKPRRKCRQEPALPDYRKGRTYDCFEAFLNENPDTSVVEMDVVEGAGGKAEKVLLTLFFRTCSLMLIFLMEGDRRECVREVFTFLYDKLGRDIYSRTFPVILTDNGSSFKDPKLLETAGTNDQLTRVFYCNPMSSWQKGRLEKNHEFIRYVLPKGCGFGDLTSENVRLMMNHINSITRASLNGHTPFELAQLLLNRKLTTACRLEQIPADQVVLKPSLMNQ